MPSIRTFALPVLLAATLGLTACGGDDDKDSASTTATTASTTATTTASTPDATAPDTSGDAGTSGDNATPDSTSTPDVPKLSADAQAEVEKIQKDLTTKLTDVATRLQKGEIKKDEATKEFSSAIDELITKSKKIDGLPAEMKSQLDALGKQLKEQFSQQLGN